MEHIKQMTDHVLTSTQVFAMFLYNK